MPAASVVVPTHNRAESLGAVLSDLSRQRVGPGAFEVLVVSSEDGQDMTHVVDQARATGLTVSLVLVPNRLSTKRNAGADRGTADVVLFVDDDMRLPDTWVGAHLDAQERHPGALVSGAVSFPREWTEQSNYRRYKNSRHLNPESGSSEGAIAPNRIVAMNCSIDRALYVRSGGTSESFTGYGGEDTEFGYRLARLGVPLVYAAGPLAFHHELTADVGQFMAKVEAAAGTGAEVLRLAPEATSAPTFRWTEPGAQKSVVDVLVHVLLVALAHSWTIGPLTQLLRRTDRWRWAYAPVLYKVLTLLCVQRGVRRRPRVAGQR